MRYINNRKGRSGDGAKRGTPYMFATQMSFLEDTVLPRKTSSSLVAPEDNQTDYTDILCTPPKNLTLSECGKKRKLTFVETKLIDALESNASRRAEKEQRVDDDRFFLLSLLPQLKLIPNNQKLSARMEIMGVINKYIQTEATYTQPNQYLNHPHNYQTQLQQHSPHSSFTPPPQIHLKKNNVQETSIPLQSPTDSIHSCNTNFSPEDSQLSLFMDL